MCKRNFYVAVVIAVIVQMVKVHSTAATLSSLVCNKVQECYVDETSSKVCKRTESKCKPCVTMKENNSVFAAFTPTEFICLDVDDNGDCPTEATKCPTKLKTPNDEELDRKDEEVALEDNKHSSYFSDRDESSKTVPTFASTEKRLVSSSSESKLPTQSTFSSNEATPTIKSSFTEKTPTILLSSSDSSGNAFTSETPKTPTPKKTTTSVAKSSTLQENEASDYSSSALHGSASASTDSNSRSSDSAGTYEAEEYKNNVDQSSISATVAPTVTTPAITKSTTKDTALSNTSDLLTAATDSSKSNDSKLGLILGIVLGAAAVVAFAGFVVWKKKVADEDPDAALNKSIMNRNVSSQPSVTLAPPAYLGQPKQYGDNNYEYPYSNNYGNNYGGDSGYSNKRAVARYVTGSTGGAAAGMVPASYGSPCSIDIDGDYDSRRTDSILGGTGVILSTKSGMMFSAGPSPMNSDTNQDIWGNEVNRVHQKFTASSASVEF